MQQTTMPAARLQPVVSIIIKALNEERHIASAIESALAALRDVDGEVILADGGSTDRTSEIARRFPIIVVQLNRIEDRSCGSGAQLGFQYSRGQYLLLMDGDMRLDPEFLAAGLEALRRNPNLAGVGGVHSEPAVVNEEYELRRKRYDPDRRAGPVTRLNGSGLYRRTAIESVGYLTDRNLHGAEEFDLGARLHAAGWRLANLDRPIVHHEPHTGSAYRLLVRRVLNKNLSAPGELLRSALGRRHFWFIVGKDGQCLIPAVVTSWWSALALTLALPGWSAALATIAILLLPFAGMSLRRRSVRLGIYSVALWNAVTFCSWLGFLRSRTAPDRWIESSVLQASGSRPGQPRATQEAQRAFGNAGSLHGRHAERLEMLP